MSEQKLSSISATGLEAIYRSIRNKKQFKSANLAFDINAQIGFTLTANKKLVHSQQLFVEGIHFNLMYTPLKHLGYKLATSAAMNITAKGGIGKSIFVNLAVSNRFTVEAIDELFEGILAAGEQYRMELLSFELVTSVKGMQICIGAIGEVLEEYAVKNQVNEYDLICVSGDLGAAYLGLQLLEREKILYEQDSETKPSFEDTYTIGRQLHPAPRQIIIDSLRERKISITSMQLLQNSLNNHVRKLCEHFDVGCKIHESRIPIASETAKVAELFNLEALVAAINGGDDFEYLFTIPALEYDKIKDIKDLSVIGSICAKEEGIHIMFEDGSSTTLENTVFS